ncbi:MAG: hypothetical protein JXB48_17075 [Candidatus Latescibacteria bacterium]|nr:hypothetical protein [Candidatus Latescibacterota bacterium]
MLVLAMDYLTEVDEKPQTLGFYVAEPRPNPFNPITVNDYTISEDNRVIITVYTIFGAAGGCFANTHKEAGRRTVIWDASELPSGVCILTIRSGNYIDTNKTLLLK